jgi:hypothetical protein
MCLTGGSFSPLQVRTDSAGQVIEIVATFSLLPPDGKRPRGNVHWVPSTAVPVEVRLYDHLFKVPFVSASWEKELNHNSEVVITGALVDPSVLGAAGAFPAPEQHFQFERIGIFVVDKDSTDGRLVVNRTVPLKVAKSAQSAPKSAEAAEKDAKRKADQAAALALKKQMENVNPVDMFKLGEDAAKYSKWDEEGVPTHNADGEPVPKSAIKKLKAAWVKQKKLFDKK